ncbi:MAG: hypothetical protein RIR26_2634 [Pseudomonadota bacterium]
MSKNRAIQIIGLLLMLLMVSTVVVSWPLVRFLYRERNLAESVRRYADTPGLPMTSDQDVRQYLVKLAKFHRLDLTEGDVAIDYQDSDDSFGVPFRIGYTLLAQVDLHGWRQVPFIAQRSFSVKGQPANK